MGPAMHSFRLQLVRGFFGIAEHVAPRLAGRLAFALFCRTSRPERTSPKARAAIDAAGDFMMGARCHRLTNAHGSFVCHEFRPPSGGAGRGTVLVLHGWASRTEHMRFIIEALLAHGLRVLALDFPGHGASPGRRLNMAVAVEAVKTVEEWFAPFTAILGHSFGGAVAVNAAAGSIRGIAPVETRRLALIAAPDAMEPVFRSFARHCRLGKRTYEGFCGRVECVAGRPLETFVGSRQLADLAMPVLVLHAPDDPEVAPADADGYAAAGPHVARRWIEGAGHRRILSHPAALEAASTFVAGLPADITDVHRMPVDRAA
jgi:pimeloyl-ACP methyl ester carboxylesterase